MSSEFKYLFDSQPMWTAEYVNKLPESMEVCKEHFISFLHEYFAVQKVCDNNYSQSMENMYIALGGKDGEIKQISQAEYWDIHSYFQRLRLYYQHLLTAARWKYDIWLNDFIPDEYKQQPKKSKRRKQTI